jgi:hypothetical protein
MPLVKVVLNEETIDVYRQRAEAEHRPLRWQIEHELREGATQNRLSHGGDSLATSSISRQTAHASGT